MNRITRIEIENYRSIKHAVVELGALNVLVGKNGAGKSNFLDVFAFVSDALRLGLTPALENRDGNIFTITDSNSETFTVELTLDISSKTVAYSFELNRKNEIVSETFTQDREVIFKRDKHKHEGQISHLPQNSTDTLWLPLLADLKTREAYQFLIDIKIYNIQPSAIRQSKGNWEVRPKLEGSGKGFVSSLAKLEFENQYRWRQFVSTLEGASDGITNVTIFRDNPRKPEVVISSNLINHLYDYDIESDGTLRIMGILLALYQEPRPSLIGIEEPEQTIHAGALPVLCDAIKEASLSSQVIITTHSPDMIARFDVNDLRIVERTNDGTKIGYIDDVQRESVEREIFGSGSLLRIDGELRRQAE